MWFLDPRFPDAFLMWNLKCEITLVCRLRFGLDAFGSVKCEIWSVKFFLLGAYRFSLFVWCVVLKVCIFSKTPKRGLFDMGLSLFTIVPESINERSLLIFACAAGGQGCCATPLTIRASGDRRSRSAGALARTSFPPNPLGIHFNIVLCTDVKRHPWRSTSWRRRRVGADWTLTSSFRLLWSQQYMYSGCSNGHPLALV